MPEFINGGFSSPRKALLKGAEIKIIGVGGGGSNAVNHMYEQTIDNVQFIVCNTDRQALDRSSVPTKIILGESLVKGNGAGSIPEVGRNAAIESLNEIKEILGTDTKIVFVTAGMGGGTGTGAAPVIAEAAKEMDILTIGIVTVPFSVEGRKRKEQAMAGVEEIREAVDTLLVISNDKLMQTHAQLKMKDAFKSADDVLCVAAKSIADIMTKPLYINTDFADIKTTMKDSGVALMGAMKASGENRAIDAVREALNSPLLNDNNIEGAKYVLLNITYGENDITMHEFEQITEFIQEAAGKTADLITGQGVDPELAADELMVTVIATGFSSQDFIGGNKVTYKIDKDNSVTTSVQPKNYTTPPSTESKSNLINPYSMIDKSNQQKENIFEEKTPKIESIETTLETENNETLSKITDPHLAIQERLEMLRKLAQNKNISNDDLKNLENQTAIDRRK